MINLSITDIYDDIDNSKAKISMKYEPNVEILDYDTNKLSDTLKNIFKTNYRKELNNGVTLFGPHRDDFSFYLDEKILRYMVHKGNRSWLFWPINYQKCLSLLTSAILHLCYYSMIFLVN